MSKQELEKFNPEKLKDGREKLIETVNPKTHYHEIHYFYRDRDGELFSGVTHGFRNARSEIRNWIKRKRANGVAGAS